MDYWVRDYNELSKATIPPDWRQKPPVHALPKRVRRNLHFTPSTEIKPKQKGKRPKSAVSRGPQRAGSTKKRRPMSASANLQKSWMQKTIPVTPLPPPEVGEEQNVSEQQFNLDLALDDFFASLQDFNATMHRTRSTRTGLVKALEAAVQVVNSANPSTSRHNTMRDKMSGTYTHRPRPRSAKPQAPHAQHEFQEPWRFGKPGAYISPVLQHRLEKKVVELKKEAKRRPTSAKKVNLSAYRNTDRERGVKLERPWSAPSRRKQGPAKMKIRRLYVNFEGVSKSPDETLILLKRLALALKPSSSSTVLPFLLNLNLKRCHLDATIEKFWRNGASEYLRQVLVHPGVEGVDMQQNGVQLLPKTGKTTTASSSAPNLADKTQDYTADFEDYDEEDEVIAALSDAKVTSAINIALEQRRSLQEVNVSPPLVDLFVDRDEYDQNTRPAPINLAPVSEEAISKAFADKLTVFQGYVVDKPIKTSVPSVGIRDKGALPSFEDLVVTISSANFNDLSSVGGSSILQSPLTESQELACERLKTMNHQANFRMRAGSYHC